MKILDDYFEIQRQIYDFFGYVEDWRVIPIDDGRSFFWRLEGWEGELHYADSEEELTSESGNYYVDEIYTQRHLESRVYRGDGFTMICCDTNTDGNVLLRVMDNAKERP